MELLEDRINATSFEMKTQHAINESSPLMIKITPHCSEESRVTSEITEHIFLEMK